MGLDITAYKKLIVVENPKLDEDGELENWLTEWTPGPSMEWSEKHFPGRGEGVELGKVYTSEDELNFRAGSYSGYNWWRSNLESFMGDKAFQELINFADSEGVIGSVVSKKLAKDFADHEEGAKKFSKTLGQNEEYWFSQYLQWKLAFELASENGAVVFR